MCSETSVVTKEAGVHQHPSDQEGFPEQVTHLTAFQKIDIWQLGCKTQPFNFLKFLSEYLQHY